MNIAYTNSKMEIRFGRIALLVLAMILVFGVFALIVMQIVPPPRKETGYPVIGTLATFASLATLFGVLITTVYKDSNALFFQAKEGLK